MSLNFDDTDPTEANPVKEEPSILQDIKLMRKICNKLAKKTNLFETRDSGLLHYYGKYDMEEAKHQFEQAIQRIRNVYNQWNEMNNPEQQKNLPKYLKNLQDKVTESTMLESLRKTLQKCCQQGEQYLLDQASVSGNKQQQPTNQLAQWIESISKQVGMSFSSFSQMADEGNTISVWAGKTLVIDIMLSTGDEVRSINVSQFEQSYEAYQLCELLANHHINEFRKSLKWMTRNEDAAAVWPQAVINNLEKDLLKIARLESKLDMSSKNTPSPLDHTLLYGHGIIERMAEYLQITFHANRAFFLLPDAEQDRIRTSHRWLSTPPASVNLENTNMIHRAFVTLQRTKEPVHLPSASQLLPDDQLDLRNGKIWLEKPSYENKSQNSDDMCDEDSESSAPSTPSVQMETMTFSLEISPGIPTGVHFHWLSSMFDSKAKFLDNSKTGRASLLSLLTNDHKTVVRPNANRQYTLGMFGKAMNFIFSGDECRAIQLCKIPFTHGSELLVILNHLRQQIVFNELVSSCCKPTGDQIPTDIDPIVFEVVFESPYLITLLFLFNDQFTTLKIKVENGGKVAAEFTQSLEHLSAYATKLIERSHHIPLSLHNLMQKFQ